MEISVAVTALSALAQESRLAIFRLLVASGPDGVPAGTIAARLGIPPATLSFHLAQLSHAGLVHAQRRGRSVIYRAEFETMRALMGFLTEKCCGGDPAACALPAGRYASATAGSGSAGFDPDADR